MNNLDQIHTFVTDEDNFKYDLSTLYTWIQCLECTRQIVYKLESAPTTTRATVE